jgi:hypothetical protein
MIKDIPLAKLLYKASSGCGKRMRHERVRPLRIYGSARGVVRECAAAEGGVAASRRVGYERV